MSRCLILLFGLCLFCPLDSVGQEFDLKGCWQPVGLPIEFCVDDDGDYQMKVSNSIITPIGKFKASAGYSISDNYRASQYHQNMSQAINYNSEIRYVEKKIEVPKYQYHLYLKYGDHVYVYEIKNSNELRIESTSGFKGKFKNSIVEINIDEEKETKVFFNSLDVREFEKKQYDYPEKKLYGRVKFSEITDFYHSFNKNRYRKSDIEDYTVNQYGLILGSIPAIQEVAGITETKLTFNPMGEYVQRKMDYFVVSSIDSISRRVLTVYDEVLPEGEGIKINRIELHYNKSTADFVSKFYKDVSVMNYFGSNINDLTKYFEGLNNGARANSLKSYLGTETHPGFWASYITEGFQIGFYSKYGNDICDLMVVSNKWEGR